MAAFSNLAFDVNAFDLNAFSFAGGTSTATQPAAHRVVAALLMGEGVASSRIRPESALVVGLRGETVTEAGIIGERFAGVVLNGD